MSTMRPEASEITGTVREISGNTVPVTDICDGAWYSVAVTIGYNSGCSTAKKEGSTPEITLAGGGASGASGSPIYFVRAGSNRARVVWRGGNSVWWALSDAGQVWFDVFDARLSASHDQRLVRFDGAGPRPALDVAITGPAATWVTYESVIGTRSDGFWTLSWPSSSGEGLSCGSAAVLRIDPRTARASVTARLPAPTVDEYDGCNGLDTDEAVVSGGRLLVLAGQSSSLRANGYAQLDAVAAPRPSP